MGGKADEVTDFLEVYPASVREIALELRQTIRSTMPGVLEMVDRPARIIGYGFGSGYRDMICSIIPSKNGVKLGLARGADLPDADGLLEGAGKRHRYVQLNGQPDLRRPGLKRLLNTALAAWKAGAKR